MRSTSGIIDTLYQDLGKGRANQEVIAFICACALFPFLFLAKEMLLFFQSNVSEGLVNLKYLSLFVESTNYYKVILAALVLWGFVLVKSDRLSPLYVHAVNQGATLIIFSMVFFSEYFLRRP